MVTPRAYFTPPDYYHKIYRISSVRIVAHSACLDRVLKMKRYTHIERAINGGVAEQRTARAQCVLLKRRLNKRVNRGVWHEPKDRAKRDIADLYVAKEKEDASRGKATTPTRGGPKLNRPTRS